ncbi:hypothetical protein TI03_03995 [Achromatium sp. WMS1]|nr:hypothetical protein TI03_03995 [Achromatium sp. WMS1]
MLNVSNNKTLRGLYAITPDQPYLDSSLITQVEQAIRGGAKLLQYRNKNANKANRLTIAKKLFSICQTYNIPLIINDDLELTQTIGAAGIHLGKNDVDLALARQKLGTQAIIGASCYNSLDLAISAQQAGANYVAFGSFFPSTTKPLATLAQPDLLKQAKARLYIPIVAIGGINHNNGAKLISQGADMLAMVGGIFATKDAETNAQLIAKLFADVGH